VFVKGDGELEYHGSQRPSMSRMALESTRWV